MRAGEKWRTGFTYRTLVGHPELGEETFSVEKDMQSGAVVAALRSWSRPGTRLAKVGRLVVRRLQVSASEQRGVDVGAHRVRRLGTQASRDRVPGTRGGLP